MAALRAEGWRHFHTTRDDDGPVYHLQRALPPSVAEVVEAETAPASGTALNPPYSVGERRGSYYPVLDADENEVETVQGLDNAESAVAALNAGTADGTPA